MRTMILFLISMLSLHSLAQSLSCVGTEPFYAVSVNSESRQMVLTMAGEKSQVLGFTKISHAAGMQTGMVSVYEGPKASATVIAQEVAGTCNDGMSDKVYPYHLVFKKGSQVLYGCCEKR